MAEATRINGASLRSLSGSRLARALLLARELEAADVRQHPVHDDEVRVPVGNCRARLPAIARAADVIARPAEIEGQHLADRPLILDYEDLLLRHRQLMG